jgi:alkylation response protein AidB-like acyl-CoA dehydrogenase
MDLEYTAAEKSFRDDVRQFIHANLPRDVSAKVLGHKRLTREDIIGWHRILHTRGWSGPTWPKEFGGPGWTAVEQHIFDEECTAAGAPPVIAFGVRMVAPVIMKYGSAAQQQHFLPRILSGEHWWCQGYSEPGAGSDLASLKTTAVRRGDSYVVNGQKTWNTLGHLADWMFCLARTSTDGRPQEGISFLLIDMKAKGISVRPIALIDGEHEVNEVWLDDVEVPIAQRVGEENKGWTYAKYLLTHERVNIARLGESKRELLSLKAIAARVSNDGRPLIEDARFRDQIAALEIELRALEYTVLRVLSAEAAGRDPGAISSALKISGSEIQQTLTELKMRALGPRALPHVPEALDYGWQGEPSGAEWWAALSGRYFNMRKTSIYSGSNEIQRNIISHRLLGL